MAELAHQPELELLALARRPRTLYGRSGDAGPRVDLAPAAHEFTLDVRQLRGELLVDVEICVDGYRWCSVARWKVAAPCVETSAEVDLGPLHHPIGAVPGRPAAAARAWFTIEGEATFGVRAREVRP